MDDTKKSILNEAARIANNDKRMPREIQGMPFRADYYSSSYSLSYDEHIVDILPKARKKEIVDTLEQIGVDAIQTSVMAQAGPFVASLLNNGTDS